MKDFPDFMKNQLNHIDSNQQNTLTLMGITIRQAVILKIMN